MTQYQQIGYKPNLDEAARQELLRLEGLDPSALLPALQDLDPTIFEHLTALLFEQQGYNTRTVGTSGDEGVDVLMRKGKLTSIAQCKRYSETVGQSTIRDLYGTMIHNQAAEAFLVTTGNISKKAREWAQGKPIRLIDGQILSEWISVSAHGRAAHSSKPTARSWASSRWLWPILALLLIFFGIAVGLAFTVFTDRISTTDGVLTTAETPVSEIKSEEVSEADGDSTQLTEDEPDPGDQSNVEATATALAENALAETAVAESITPTTTSTSTPLPTCQRPVVAEFDSLYRQETLGCPTSDKFVTWAAWQPFQEGYLFWRSDEDTSYALTGRLGGRWQRLNLSGERQPVDRGEPPTGMEAPVRGFGYLWSSDDKLFQNIGWATDKEKGFCVAMQGFEQGLILQSTPVDSCTPNGLYNQAQSADWTPIRIVSHVDGRWSVNANLPNATSQAPSSSGVTSGTGTGTSQEADTQQTGAESGATDDSDNSGNSGAANSGITASRPAQHGLFRGGAADALALDGNLADWGNSEWIPISSVVWGAEQRSSSQDLSGDFKVAWSSTGLWVAIRVNDERYEHGPFGTNMWQGDGLELQFDRDLAGDLDSSVMNSDDFQIGISFGPNLNQITAYRWIPFDLEGSIPIRGAARATTQGYEAEFNLLWSTFGLTNLDVQPGERYGFNLSINDNDSSSPAQETTMSASPGRTDHKTPPEWGTLVLE